jgi:hypothetical protein
VVDRDGLLTVGQFAVAALVAATIAAPFAAYVGDRFRPDRALAATYAIQGVVYGATAAAMWAEVELPAFVLAATSVAAVTVTRPLVGALVPRLVQRPAELVASNVVTGALEQFGLFLGPLSAAAILAVADPATVFAAATALVMFGAATTATIRVEGLPSQPRVEARTVLVEATAGLVAVARDAGLRAIVGVLTVGAIVAGLGDVVVVTFASERLDGGGQAVGVLLAAIGLGGVIGATLLTRFIARHRVGPPLLLASTLATVPFAVLATTDDALAATALLALAGAGLGLSLVLGTVAMQRIGSHDLLARIFGVQEALTMAGLAIGAAIATVLLDRYGVATALVLAGCGGALLGAFATFAFARSPGNVPPPDAATVDRLLAEPLFAPLGVQVIERLAHAARSDTYAPGEAIVTSGEQGDEFFVICEGALSVYEGGEERRRLEPGDSFGEIALLSDSPRTATVVAETNVVTLAVGREDFLFAVTGHPTALESARSRVAFYLDEDRRALGEDHSLGNVSDRDTDDPPPVP